MSKEGVNKFIVTQCPQCIFYMLVIAKPGRCLAPGADPAAGPMSMLGRRIRDVGEDFSEVPPGWCPLRNKPIEVEVRLKE